MRVLCLVLLQTIKLGTEIFLDAKKSQKMSAVVRWGKNGHVTRKNYSCVVSHIIRVLVVEELQCLAKKGAAAHAKVVNLVSFSPGTPRRVLEQQPINERVSVRGIHWWTLGLDG